MNVKNWLEVVAYVGPSQLPPFEDQDCENPECYYSKYDDSYITQVGMEDSVKHLADREITGELRHGVGYSPKEEKWYGWSHRAIYGFNIGSTCKKGDCHYRAANIEEELQAAIAFWTEEDHLDVKGVLQDDGQIKVTWTISENVPNESRCGTVSGAFWDYKEPFGKGEWVAETMEDAQHMAMDFNEGVS